MTDVRHIGGPERIYDKNAADPNWKPRPVGFTANIEPDREETDGRDVPTRGRD